MICPWAENKLLIRTHYSGSGNIALSSTEQLCGNHSLIQLPCQPVSFSSFFVSCADNTCWTNSNLQMNTCTQLHQGLSQHCFRAILFINGKWQIGFRGTCNYLLAYPQCWPLAKAWYLESSQMMGDWFTIHHNRPSAQLLQRQGFKTFHIYFPRAG